MKLVSPRRTFFILTSSILLIALVRDVSAQKASSINKEELTSWLNQHRDCPPESPLYFWRLDYFDFKADGNKEAIVVASSCMTGTGGPDIHSVIDRTSSGRLMEIDIPDAVPETYDSLFGNRNYDLTVQDGLLVATFEDDRDRPTPLIIKYKLEGKKFSIASIKKTGVFPTSYDCAKAETEVERAICYVKELADLDLQLSSTYQSLVANLPADKQAAMKSEQQTWLVSRDRGCAPYKGWVGCIREAYQERIKELAKHTAPLGTTKPQEKP